MKQFVNRHKKQIIGGAITAGVAGGIAVCFMLNGRGVFSAIEPMETIGTNAAKALKESNVRGFVRNLPSDWHASPDKQMTALLHGADISLNPTWVTPHIRMIAA